MSYPESDPYDLHRFVEAQAGTFESALAELRSGQKRSHWMWFIFPQYAGLGFSSMARRYAIRSSDEAVAYLDHPALGPRVRACCEAALAVSGRTAEEFMGYPDCLKLQSSTTLFDAVVEESDSVFARVLEKYYQGVRDESTLRLLSSEAG